MLAIAPDPPGGNGRTLSVCCYAGLGNRLRVLISSLALAEATGRQLTLYWPRSPEGGAAFAELFDGDLNTIEPELAAIKRWPAYGGWFDPPMPDLFRSNQPHIQISTTDWLVQPALYPSHIKYLRRCSEFLDGLRPAGYVRAQVQTFQAEHFRPAMIGVHLRRGDFRRAQPGSVNNTASALAAVASQLEHLPDAGILLCTDDGAIDPWTQQPWSTGVRAEFARAFGERLVTTQPRTLDRQRPEAVQDALIDLLLLRQTQAMVGTRSSTFSEMAVFGRAVPMVYCQSSAAHSAGVRLGRWLTTTGLDQPYRRAMVQRYGKYVPVRLLVIHATAGPRLWLRGWLQRHWPALYRWVRARRGLPTA